MNESTGYALDDGKPFPPIRGKVKRKGISPRLKRQFRFLETHDIIVSRDPETGKPIAIIKDKS